MLKKLISFIKKELHICDHKWEHIVGDICICKKCLKIEYYSTIQKKRMEEMYNIEQGLDIPYHLRYHKTFSDKELKML